MSKASTGLRMIALRISGTELDKKTLQDLGEDVEDFEIKTKSKTDADIRALTAVASNNYEGVSVLDKNGSMRSTFDILKDIADVYTQIQEEDKKMGTNRSAALLETLAGKNRANIAASILGNPDTLSAVKEESEQKSAGYSDRNLGIYLDSLEAQTAKFKNQAAELAYSAINTNFLKGVTGIGTGALSAATWVSDHVGVAQTLIGSVLGYALEKSGNQLFKYDSTKGLHFGAETLAKGLGSTIRNAFSEVSYEFEDQSLGRMLLSASGVTPINKFVDSQGGLSKFGEQFQTWHSQLADPDNVTVEQAIEQFSQKTVKTNASSILHGITKIGTSVLSNIATIGLTTVGMWGINELIGMADDYIHRDEIAIQKGQEAQSNIQKIMDGYKKQDEYIETNFDDYLSLRKGVSYSENGIKNRSLTAEDYSKFITMNNELANLFPMATEAFDSNGNPLLSFGINYANAQSQIDQLLDDSRVISAYKVGTELPTAADGLLRNLKELSTNVEAQSKTAEMLSEVKTLTTSDISSKEALMNLGFSEDLSSFRYTESKDKNANEWARNVLIAYQKSAQEMFGADMIPVTMSVDGTNDVIAQLDTSHLFGDWGQKFENTLVSNLSDYVSEELPERFGEASSEVLQNKQEMRALWNAFVPSLSGALPLYDNYRELEKTEIGKQLTDLIQNDLLNADILSENKHWQSEFKVNPMRWARQKYLDPIYNAISDAEGNIDDEKLSMIDSIINPDKSQSVIRTRTEMLDTLSALTDGNKENINTLASVLGLGTVGENGVLSSIYDKDLSSMSRVTGIAPGELVNLSVEDYEYASQLMNSGAWSYKLGTDFKEYLDSTRQAEQMIAENDSKFSELLADTDSDTGLQKTTDNIQTLTSTIDTYRDSLKKGEDVNIADMIQDLPELANLVSDFSNAGELLQGLDKLKADNISSFASAFKEMTSGLSADELEKAQGYLREMFSGTTFDNTSIDTMSDKIKESIHASVFEGITEGATDKQIINAIEKEGSLYGQAMTAIGGDENAYQAFYSLLLQGNTPEQAMKYLPDYASELKKINNKNNTLAKISNDLAMNETNKSLAEAMQTQAQYRNGFLTPDDYNKLVDISGSNVDLAEKYYNVMRGEYKDALKEYEGDQSEANYNAMRTAQSNYIEARTSWINAQNEATSMLKTQNESTLNKPLALLNEQTYQANQLENQIEHMRGQGQAISQDMANQLTSVYSGIADTNMALYNESMNLAENAENDVDALQYKNNALEYLQSAQNAKSGAETSSILSYQTQVDNLQRDLTTLQSEATELNETMTLDQGKALIPTIDQYQKLVDNGKAQIDNLKQTNENYEKMKENVKSVSELASIQQMIDANESAISSMNGSIIEWNNAISDYFETVGKSGLNAISTALSESLTDTGISAATMRTLEGQFGRMEEMDFASLFYSTADGVKLDVEATKDLAEAQHKLISDELALQLNRQNKELEQQVDLYSKATSEAERQQLAQSIASGYENLGKTYQQMAQYEAAYKEQQEQLSGYNAWVNAQESANAGAKYSAMQGYLDDMSTMDSSHLYGTDEYKTFVQMIDQWGRDSHAAYQENLPKLDRYLTDDITGVTNFFSDLVEAGYGTYSSGQGYKINAPNSKEGAAALGIGEEFYEYMWGRIEDYGGINAFVGDSLEGQLKIAETAHDIATEIEREAKNYYNGAPSEVLEENQANLSSMQSQMDAYIENTSDMIQQENSITGKEIMIGARAIQQINDLMGQTTDAGAKLEYANAIKDVAQRYGGIPLNDDLSINTKALENMYAGYSEDANKVFSTARNTSLDVATGAAETIFGAVNDKVLDTVEGNGISNVTDLQRSLNQLGYSLAEDGIYGSLTAEAVRQYQAQNGLTVDGVAGAQTIASLEEKMGLRDISPISSSGLSQYAGVTQFDAMSMSAEELNAKLSTLNEAREALNTGEYVGGEAAVQQMDTLIAATEKQLTVQQQLEELTTNGSTSYGPMTTDQFASADVTTQQNVMADLGVAETDYRQFIDSAESQTITMKIETVMDSTGISLDELQQMTDTELQTTLNLDASQVEEARSIIESMSSEEVNIPVKIDAAQFESLLSAINPEIEATANVEEVNTSDQSVEVSGTVNVDQVNNTEQTVELGATATVEQVESSGESVNISATVTAEAVDVEQDLDTTATVNYSAGDIPEVPDAESTVNYGLGSQDMPSEGTSTVYYTLGGQDPPSNMTATVTYVSGGTSASASGTMSAPAYASGTVSDGEFKSLMSAFGAGTPGDVSLAQNQNSLVNELGTESIIRDGRWFTIPGGMHVESLKKGDIVLNHKQTEDLIHHGSAHGTGNLVGGMSSFARGTAYSGMSAHSSVDSWFDVSSGGSGSGSSDGVTINGDNNSVTYDYGDYNYSTTTEDTDPEGGSTVDPSLNDDGFGPHANTDKSGSDKFAYEVFDYVSIRLEYFANQTKEIADKLTQYVSNKTRGKLLREEIASLQDEIYANNRAATAYMVKASEIANEFAYADDNGKKQTIKLTDKFDLDKLLRGEYNLEDYDTSSKKNAAYVDAAKQYVDYHQKAMSATQATQSLSNSLRELYSNLIALPTDKLNTSLEKIERRLSTITSLDSAMSSGAAGLRTLQRVYQGLVDDSTDPALVEARENLQKANDKVAKKQAKVDKKQAKIDKKNENITTYGKDMMGTITSKLKKQAKAAGNMELLAYIKDASKLGIKLDKSKFTGKSLELVKAYNYLLGKTGSGKKIDNNLLTDYVSSLIGETVDDYNSEIDARTEAKEAIKPSKQALKDAKKEQKVAQSAYDKAEEVILTDSARDVMKADLTKPTYVAQNRNLKNELKQERKELKKTYKAYQEQIAIHQELIQKRDEDKKSLKDAKKALLDSNKLTDAQKEAIRNGENIDTKDIPSDIADAVAEYNRLNSSVKETNSAISESEDKVDSLKETTMQAAASVAQKTQALAKESLENIDNYFSAYTSYYSQLADKVATRIQLAQELGRERGENGKYVNNVTTPDYKKEIKYLKKARDFYNQSADEQEAELARQVKAGTIKKGDEEYVTAMTNIKNLRDQAMLAEIEIDKLYDSIVFDVKLSYWEEPIKKLQEMIEKVEKLNSLISEEAKYTTDGDFTELGVASLTLQVVEYRGAQQELKKNVSEIEKLKQLYNGGFNDLGITAEEYDEKMKELQDRQLSILSSAKETKDNILKTITNRYKTELNYINKLIDARKEEIQKQKEMYNYDRNLKNQTKDIKMIEQQIRALETLTDAESKAQKARLEAQLRERQDDLQDTVTEHVADMRYDALTDLSEQLQENLDKLIKDLEINMATNTDMINEVSKKLTESLDNTNKTLENFLRTFGSSASLASLGLTGFTASDIKLQGKKTSNAASGMTFYENGYSADENAYYASIKDSQSSISANTRTIADILKNGSAYASGTRSAKGGWSRVNEDGPETIVTKSGVFLPLSPGDAVIPSGLTENLFDLARTGMSKASLTAGAIKAPNYNVSTDMSTESHFDNLLNITVEGNLDSSVVPQIEDIAKGLQANRGFMEGIYQHTAKSMSKDLRKTR